MELTDKQLAVVAHGEGPALVYAVAGAGKTTAMKHRIRRLVLDDAAAPDQILAASFANANVSDLQRGLASWPECRGVYSHTLHSLGRSIIKAAYDAGHPIAFSAETDPRSAASEVFHLSFAEATKARVPYAEELNAIERDDLREDFLDYVGACKGNLLYPDLAAADLPRQASSVAAEAPAPEVRPWYLLLYRRFEQIRLAKGWITYDDMLLSGWEALVRYPDVLARVQSRFRYVLVDEFQDVNRAQAEILDLIVRPHGNYMAIGDDDQTIYEWRGASAGYVRDFPQRYPGAAQYVMDDCFRCPAAPLSLANAVISRDRERKPKRLQLTRGFIGGASVTEYAAASAQADSFAAAVESEARSGRPLEDVAMLVRLTAQTPPLEQALTSRGIQYHVVGDGPFYDRAEVRLLLDYCRVASLGAPDGVATLPQVPTAADLRGAWLRLYNRPTRYVRRDTAEAIWSLVDEEGLSPADAIERAAGADDRARQVLLKLTADLRWLGRSLPRLPAAQLLDLLEGRLQYKDHLRTATVSDRGAKQAENVGAFIEYSRGRGTLPDFLGHLADLERKRRAAGRQGEDRGVRITTIHRAKGLEWPLVFLPDCDEGTIPHAGAENLAEERRLLYVAITRCRERLVVGHVRGRPLSRFLEGCAYAGALSQAGAIASALDSSPAAWGAPQALDALCRGVYDLGLQRYFAVFWPAGEEAKAAAVSRIRSVYESARAGKLKCRVPRGAQVEHWRAVSEAGWQAPLEPIEAPPEPRIMVRPSMWAHTDAGWGIIRAIRDGGGKPVRQIETNGSTNHVLDVTLRPGQDAEPVRVHLTERRVEFTRAPRVHTCAACGQFSAADPHLIFGKHTRSAHGGTSGRVRGEPSPAVKLTAIQFQDCEPPDQLA